MAISTEASRAAHACAEAEHNRGRTCPPAPSCRITNGSEAVCAKPEGLKQQRSVSVAGVLPYAAACMQCLGKVMPLTPAPALPILPPPEQLATILGRLICCDLSSQNICLKKDQIFIAHLCILLKGETRLVMVDKCQSTCKERKGRERKGGREHCFNMQYLYFSAPTVSLPLLSVLMLRVRGGSALLRDPEQCC